jgi:putative ABC transport system substrate-binding protein
MKKAVVPSIVVAVVLLALGVAVEAQQPKKVPRIGAFVPASASGAPQLIEALRQGLREHGYVEEQNITLEPRYAEGNIERLAGFAAELVRLKADVIVVGSTPGIIAVKNTTGAIPIVMVTTGDPVAGGLVASLARPWGEHHGTDRSRARVKRETVGGPQGSRPEGLPGGCALESNESRQ